MHTIYTINMYLQNLRGPEFFHTPNVFEKKGDREVLQSPTKYEAINNLGYLCNFKLIHFYWIYFNVLMAS